ncbi:MAG: membrane protein insertion efficiency factor YidD [Pseudomonadota bacterium]
MLSRIALGGICAYQRYLSPRKGFRCAYSVAHGGTGCSGYAKFAIRDHGFWCALPLIRQRFRACQAAYVALRRSEEEDRERRAQRRKDGLCDTACCGAEGCAYLPSAASACRGGAAAGKSKTCDINPCDGDIGCGGFDICSCG